MEFINDITLPLPADDVFAAMTDVDRIASCMPGARLVDRDGNAYRGVMRIKVGPIVAQYGGLLNFEELDATARRAVMVGSGEEASGQGSAQARIIGQVDDNGSGGSRVLVRTELQVAGRVAQFGSGAMEKIAKKLFVEFIKNLERSLLGDRGTAVSQVPATSEATDGATTSTAGSARPLSAAPPISNDSGVSDSLDVMDLVGEPIAQALRSVAPALIGLIIGYLVGKLRGIESQRNGSS